MSKAIKIHIEVYLAAQMLQREREVFNANEPISATTRSNDLAMREIRRAVGNQAVCGISPETAKRGS